MTYKCIECDKEYKSIHALNGHTKIHSVNYYVKPKKKYIPSTNLINLIECNNKYQKWYNAIINKANKRSISELDYYETHHIIPRSLKGSNHIDNLVRLTAKEHFICHALLVKIFPVGSYEWKKMNHAFSCMRMSKSNNKNRYFNSKLYEYFRKNLSNAMSLAQSGNKNSQYNTTWVSHIELENCEKININELDIWVQKGYINKRITDFNKFKEKIKNKQNRIILAKIKKEKRINEVQKLYNSFKLSELSYRGYAKQNKLCHINMYRTFKKYKFI